MNASPPHGQSKSASNALFVAILLGTCFLASAFTVTVRAGGTREMVEKIECITPDGRLAPISNSDRSSIDTRGALAGRGSISYNLQEGETTFIIPFPKGALLDRFTFINENAAACGEFNIAVANSHLSPESTQWTEVDGIVPFAHKRLFNLSMVGIDAKYVKLSFRVEKNSRITRAERRPIEKQKSDSAIKLAEAAPPAAGPNDR